MSADRSQIEDARLGAVDQSMSQATAATVFHNRLTHGADEVEAVSKTIRSGYWANGQQVTDLEQRLAKIAGVKHAVCVGSGVAALRLTLLGQGVKSGDRVLIPAYSCVALANVVLACGAEPVPIDVNYEDWNLSYIEATKIIDKLKPKAAIAINMFGAPAAVEQMSPLGIPIIEDCAHAFGLELNGNKLGGRGTAGVLSFYATKLIGAGEGGCILTDSDELGEFARSWRDYTDLPPDGMRLNDKMTDIEATLALCQLNRLPAMLAARQRLAERYYELLKAESDKTQTFKLPDVTQTRVWYRYAVEMLAMPASEAVEQLQSYDVQAAIPVADWRQSDAKTHPVAGRAYQMLLSLPLYPTLTDEEQDRVVSAFLDVVRKYDKS